jgi:hypothetical protein
MRHHIIMQLLVSTLAALVLTVFVPATLRAQDRPDDRRDQHDQGPAEHGDDHPAARPNPHRSVGRPDPVVQYRHDHPHASARCHDGFFTTTSDRNRACSKHGGIDVWLVL